MRAHEPGVRLRLAISAVWDLGRQRAAPARPVVVRDEVEVLVKRSLGLFPYDAEDLVDRSVPVVVHERGVLRRLIVRPRQLEEAAKRVDFVLHKQKSSRPSGSRIATCDAPCTRTRSGCLRD